MVFNMLHMLVIKTFRHCYGRYFFGRHCHGMCPSLFVAVIVEPQFP